MLIERLFSNYSDKKRKYNLHNKLNFLVIQSLSTVMYICYNIYSALFKSDYKILYAQHFEK